MTYTEALAEVKKFFAGKKSKGNKKHFVAEVEITDGGGGVFYIEFVEDKAVNVEDKSYPNKDLHLTTDVDTFDKVALKGTMDPAIALGRGLIKLGRGIFLDGSKAKNFAALIANCQ